VVVIAADEELIVRLPVVRTEHDAYEGQFHLIS
jgi:hypothetical protein